MSVLNREKGSWRAMLSVLICSGLCGLLSACGGSAPYVADRIEDPLELPVSAQSPPSSLRSQELEGEASWYGNSYHGRTTASGAEYNMYAFTAAHKTLPFGTIVRVTRTDSQQSVVVEITDRGPYADGRVIDLSFAAAWDIGIYERGVAPVRIDILHWGG